MNKYAGLTEEEIALGAESTEVLWLLNTSKEIGLNLIPKEEWKMNEEKQESTRRPHKDANCCFLCYCFTELITIQLRVGDCIVGELYMCFHCEKKYGQYLTFNPLTLWEEEER